MPTTSKPKDSNFYEILQLQYPIRTALTGDDVKVAFHKALLRNHPDKTTALAVNKPPHQESHNGSTYSIDLIIEAYQTLSDPAKRSVYDRTLSLGDERGLHAEPADKGTHSGVEIVDLEELEFDEDSATWSRGCRCGDGHGYMVTEEDLERESSDRELYVGCKGCSLFIRVLFSTAEAEEHA